MHAVCSAAGGTQRTNATWLNFFFNFPKKILSFLSIMYLSGNFRFPLESPPPPLPPLMSLASE